MTAKAAINSKKRNFSIFLYKDSLHHISNQKRPHPFFKDEVLIIILHYFQHSADLPFFWAEQPADAVHATV